MKNKLLIRISLSAIIILFSGLFYQSKAQVVKEKKSNPDIFFPDRKRTHPVTVRTQPVIVRTRPVIVSNDNNLPPGHAKKIYGEKSAKRFAPGQRKKSYDNNWYYNKNRKHVNKKGHHHYKNKKHHDD